MREIRTSGSEGGEAELNRPSLPLSKMRMKKGEERRVRSEEREVKREE